METREETGSLVIETRALRLTLAREDGSVRGVRHLGTGQELVEPGASAAPWRIYGYGTTATVHPPFPTFEDTRFPEITPETFVYDVTDDGVDLTWTTSEPAVTVHVTVRAGDDGSVELWPRMRNAGAAAPEHLVYPIIPRPRRLSPGGEDDVLVFPAHSGWLIRRPLDEQPFDSTYPDGYRGCSMQALGYIQRDVGGFYLATHDPHSTFKRYAFSATDVRVHHYAYDLRTGADLDLGYPVVLAALGDGDWYEVADRYRQWALDGTPWTDRGPLWDRSEDRIVRWLHEEVGVSLWGPPSSVDWSSWYRFYGDAVGVPLHVVAGWDWPGRRPHALGYEGWFPARFHEANRAAWEGHRVTPYMNDQFISSRADGFHERWEPSLFKPYVFFPFTIFSDAGLGALDPDAPGAAVPDTDIVLDTDYFLCPAAPDAQDLHEWRDVTLIRDNDLDGVYYDISSGIPLANQCLSVEHGHTPGWAREIFTAYDEVNRRTKRALLRESGVLPAQGVETIIESMIGGIDFYVSRACAGPLGVIESFLPAREQPPGTGRELIPLFQAVYHDHGPVHQDGWLQFSEKIGDVFYWVAARIMLQWGGMLSLQYAINYPERYAGTEEVGRFVGWEGAVYESADLPAGDPAKIDFARELALARTTYGNRHLGYGRLVRPAGVDTPTLDVDYHEHFDAHLPGGSRHGTWAVPRVVEAGWVDPLGNLGLFFADLGAGEPLEVDLDVDLVARWGIDAPGALVRIVDPERETELAPVDPSGRLRAQVALRPRGVTLVEVLSGTIPDERAKEEES